MVSCRRPSNCSCVGAVTGASKKNPKSSVTSTFRDTVVNGIFRFGGDGNDDGAEEGESERDGADDRLGWEEGCSDVLGALDIVGAFVG